MEVLPQASNKDTFFLTTSAKDESTAQTEVHTAGHLSVYSIKMRANGEHGGDLQAKKAGLAPFIAIPFRKVSRGHGLFCCRDDHWPMHLLRRVSLLRY